MGRAYAVLLCIGLAFCKTSLLAAYQTPTVLQREDAAQTLTLAQAESIAIANAPRIIAASLRAQASAQRIREARSALLPTVGFNATGVRVADAGTSTAAGNITTSSLSDRFAYGGSLIQMVTDFGRTIAVIGTERSLAEAQKDEATFTRAQMRKLFCVRRVTLRQIAS
jgi:outer membrane protein